jgi:hypothetical protein
VKNALRERKRGRRFLVSSSGCLDFRDFDDGLDVGCLLANGQKGYSVAIS